MLCFFSLQCIHIGDSTPWGWGGGFSVPGIVSNAREGLSNVLDTIALGFFLDFSALCGALQRPPRFVGWGGGGDRVSCGAEHASERTGY